MKLKTLSQHSVLIVFFVVAACSHQKVKNGSSSSLLVPQSEVADIDKPNAMSPEPANTSKYGSGRYLPIVPSTGSMPEAVVAVALAGAVAGFSKISEAPELKSDLYGNCSYGDPETPMLSPCVNMKVNLIDQNGQVCASASTNQAGNFQFYIPQNQKYYVQVIDRKSRTASTKTLVGRAEAVSLYLKP